MSHRVVVLENLSVSRLFGAPWASESGSCRATETTEGERESWISSSFAPDERPESLMVRERSTCLLLFLESISLTVSVLLEDRFPLAPSSACLDLGLYAYLNPY